MNRWEIEREGSDVLIAVVFVVPGEREPAPVPFLRVPCPLLTRSRVGAAVPFVLLFEMDLQHHERTAENAHVLFFDRLVFDHMKAFFESWRERGYCSADIE